MPVWRYDQNPIIGRYEQKRSNSIFNSAVVPFEDGYVGVFRCDSRSISMDIFVGRSKDGIHWEIEDEPIKFEGADEEILTREYRYDPRVCKIDDKYYVTWCNGYHGPTIGVAYTYDFKKFVQLENAFLPFNRNGVLFPRKINGYYMMMSRPSDNGHTPFGVKGFAQLGTLHQHRAVCRQLPAGRVAGKHNILHIAGILTAVVTNPAQRPGHILQLLVHRHIRHQSVVNIENHIPPIRQSGAVVVGFSPFSALPSSSRPP